MLRESFGQFTVPRILPKKGSLATHVYVFSSQNVGGTPLEIRPSLGSSLRSGHLLDKWKRNKVWEFDVQAVSTSLMRCFFSFWGEERRWTAGLFAPKGSRRLLSCCSWLSASLVYNKVSFTEILGLWWLSSYGTRLQIRRSLVQAQLPSITSDQGP